MKRILLILIMAISLGSLSAQECTLRLEMPATTPAIGEEFFVEVWMDVLDYPGYTLNGGDPTLKSGQMGLLFDEAVLTPVKTSGPPALQKYAWNINAMFADYSSKPIEGYPNPGDLRFVSFTTADPGMDPLFYGGIPMHMWDLKFIYNGGDIAITWQDEDFTAKVNPILSGGSKEKIVSFWTAWDNAAYAMTYVNIPATVPETGFEWTGVIDSDWDDVNNWLVDMMVPANAPTQTDDVEIPVIAGKAVYPTIIGSAATAALTIMPGAQLNIAAMADLTTYGMFTNDGMFVIESLNTGEAGSYIDMMGIAGIGMFEFQRDITNVTSYGSQTGWHFISSPLPLNEFNSDALHYYYTNWFNNATQQYVSIEGDPQVPCTPAATLTNGMMEGWSIKYDDQYAALCAGGMEDYVINMMGSSFNTGIKAASFGTAWNLLGNPYPSAIDPDLVTWSPNLNSNTVYMWDGWADSWVLGANGLGNNIPPAQGFFVDGAIAGNFAFAGTERLHDNAGFWYKNSSDLLRLRATTQGANNYADAYIRFNETATAGLDKQWDASKKYAGVVTPEIYTTTNGLELALNTQPSTDMVSMAFVCGTAGTYTIQAVETGSFSYVLLEDLVSGEQTNLLQDAYTFNYTNVEQVNNFIVHFAPLSIGELGANSVNIWARDNNIMVNVPSNVTGEIAVYNMMGQQVVRTDIEGVETQIAVSDVNTNYIVKVISESNTVTGKVYVK